MIKIDGKQIIIDPGCDTPAQYLDDLRSAIVEMLASQNEDSYNVNFSASSTFFFVLEDINNAMNHETN